MAMSKKHYQYVATILHDARVAAHRGELVKGGELEYVMHRLATMFAADNSYFDRQRFVDACVVGNERASGRRTRRSA